VPSERWVEKAREWWDKHAKEEPDTTCCDSEAQERATIAWAEDVNRDGVAALAALLEEVEASAVEDFLSEEPCPKCRCGPSWECYGCKWKDAQRERDEALERETLNRQAAEKWYESSESYRTLRDEARAEERERVRGSGLQRM
jgi:hypothetical protein